ncbi:MAG: DUF4837 family protein [Prolixibacteraceae bacterium]|jgi:hypothetical protein|nr:DUF4837 family protein [Prolixibacteraceae bacterium]
MKKTFIYSLFLLFVISACSSRNQTSMMKSVTGKAGELVIVIPAKTWKRDAGKSIWDLLAQPQAGLPQGESLFDVINIPEEAFGDIFKTSRNIVITKINSSVEKPTITFQKDVYAYTQAMLSISVKNEKQFVEIVNKNADKILSFFIKAERDRLVLNYSKYTDKALRTKVENKFGVSITIPPGFRVAEQSEDFMWIRNEMQDLSQGVLIYSYPYVNDSTFTSKYLVAKRNVFLKKYVPGPIEGSYMTTETDLPILFNVMKKDGNYAAELRGLWRVENDFMGGPFVSLTMLDLLKKRVLTFDAYVYAPKLDKRNYIRQVEAMIYSAEFMNQTDIDKINKQFD